ncbi:MAG: electron transport complex subunit E [Candidatus Margulisbacteria bacterium]|nr:electron transport complex subunit E [Candidatus Margulisiibacteriota bacterium]MBU1021557.1 electron transport complex subunit E [Candidatus Margulisiibacteriota bacterium]MBU1728708.1 electron transport complex subunit E [Candidatus Margulisiibacteriota bacterium]MBU1955159.1 electron transport complex subunit E [Candidatus Margulisiibacteriota bacterium]
MSLVSEFTKGIYKENPVFRLLLGMCPTLAVTTTVINGIGMAVASTFVLLGSNIIVSLIKNITPKKIRIPTYIIVIASFTTIADLLLAAFAPALHKSLGIFIPLIVVNCIIFGRAEAFASKNTLSNSIMDALGMGFGFLLALILVSSVREILGSGSILGFSLLGPSYNPALIMVLPPGAFLVLGLLIGLMNLLTHKSATSACH